MGTNVDWRYLLLVYHLPEMFNRPLAVPGREFQALIRNGEVHSMNIFL